MASPSLIDAHPLPHALRNRRSVSPNGVAFTKEGKLVRNATGYEYKELKPIRHRVREPSFRLPFERIMDPQISLTRCHSLTTPLERSPYA